MLEYLMLWIMSTCWKVVTMILTGFFTEQAIPIIFFFGVAFLFSFAFTLLKIKCKDTWVRTRKWSGWVAVISFVLSMITVGVINQGLAIDTLDQSVNVIPTGDYVIVGICLDIGGENLNLCPIDDFYAKSDTLEKNAWRNTRFVHFIPEQIEGFQPKVGMAVTLAQIEDNYRVFPRLKPLPGDEDEEEDADHQPALGYVP